MQHIEKGALRLRAFLNINENIQTIIKKTRIFDPFSTVKCESHSDGDEVGWGRGDLRKKPTEAETPHLMQN